VSDDRKVFFVRRRITFHTGEVFDLPLGMYDNKPAASAVIDERNAAFTGLLQNGWVAVARALKDGTMALEGTDQSVKDLMRDIGIASIGHGAIEVPVRASGLVIPDGPKIILPH
jgi:hypothetical protein